MSRTETMNGLQISRTRKRLRVSRMFGLSLLSLPLFGASAWSGPTLFGPLLFLIGVLLAVTGFCGRLWCLSYVAGLKNDNFPDYKEYKRRVPLLVPRWSNFAAGDGKVSACDFGREIVPAGGFLLLIGVFAMLNSLHAAGLLPTYFLIP